MLDPTTLITKYFARRATANSAANAKHMTAISHQLMAAVTHPCLLTLTMHALRVKILRYTGPVHHRRLLAITGTASSENAVALDSTVPVESSR